MTTAEIRERLIRSGADVKVLFEAPGDVLTKSYGPGKWTIHQILVHLADSELAYLWRVLRAIAETGSRVEGFDQDQWAAKLEYETRSLTVARGLFEGCRAQVLELVGRVSEAELQHTVEHSEAGPLTLQQLLEFMVAHVERHLDQIAAAREGRLWTPVDADGR